SNGRLEARVFELASDSSPRPLAEVLADVDLECLAGAEPSRVDVVAPSEAFATLFAAASTGGACDHGRRGAYGRLAAWQALTALAGARPDVPFEQAAELAERTRWYAFESDAGWFDDVAWDIGLAAVAADVARLTVLAATDTD